MRIKIFILSTVLITLISGVLYYKNLTQISVGKNLIRLDIDELKSIDQQIASTAFYLRQNLNSDLSDLQSEKVRIKELQELINDINKSSPELLTSVTKILAHYHAKLKTLDAFERSIVELRSSVNALLPTYTEMEKKNIKFSLEKRDFYRECLLDAYMYISFPHKDNEMRVAEDLKILGQIINFASTPSPEVQKFSGHMEVIQKRVKDISRHLTSLKEDSVQNEVKIIGKYYQDSIEEQNQQNENLLTFMVVAIGVYLIFMILLLTKK
jgi:chromosome segregation ATPase